MLPVEQEARAKMAADHETRANETRGKRGFFSAHVHAAGFRFLLDELRE